MRLPALAQGGASTAVPSSDALKSVDFKIHGWDRFDAVSTSNNEQFAFRVNQGWRSAWR
jgi:plasmid maintenance system killer protein